jgi:hypothetical protein
MSDHRGATTQLLHVLNACWPATLTVDPDTLGMQGEPGAREFVQAVQELCDDGFLSYEAFVTDGEGPRALGAYLTRRGRAYYTSG